MRSPWWIAVAAVLATTALARPLAGPPNAGPLEPEAPPADPWSFLASFEPLAAWLALPGWREARVVEGARVLAATLTSSSSSASTVEAAATRAIPTLAEVAAHRQALGIRTGVWAPLEERGLEGPWLAAAAAAAESADASSRRRALQSSEVVCNGVGRLVPSTTVANECNGVSVTPATRATIDALQSPETPDATFRALTLTLLAAPDADVAALVPGDTPLPADLNLTEALTPLQLAVLLAVANVSSAEEIVNVSQLLPPGVLVLQPAAVLPLLPVNASRAILQAINCTATETTTNRCACPIDFLGDTCSTPANFTCRLQLSDGTEALPGRSSDSNVRARDAALVQCLARAAPSGGGGGGGEVGVGWQRPPGDFRGFEPKNDGDPPCLLVSRAGSSGSSGSSSGSAVPTSLDLNLAVQCGYFPGEGPTVFRCNGTEMTPAFVRAELAARNRSESDPGHSAEPYYGLGCVEETFSYAVGSPASGFALSHQAPSVTLRIRPVDFTRLSDTRFVRDVALDAREFAAGTIVHHSLPLEALPQGFFAGGRLYVEAFLLDTPSSSSSSVAREPQWKGPRGLVRVVADDVAFSEPPAKTEVPVGLIVGLVVAFVALVLIALAYAWRQRRDREFFARVLREAEEAAQAEREALAKRAAPQ